MPTLSGRYPVSCANVKRDLTAAQRRFKLDVNAQENHLAGVCLVCEDAALCRGRAGGGGGAHKYPTHVSLVLVEGGKKCVRHFSKLMTRRMKWNQKVYGGAGGGMSDGEEDGGSGVLHHPPEPNWCTLVWQARRVVLCCSLFMGSPFVAPR